MVIGVASETEAEEVEEEEVTVVEEGTVEVEGVDMAVGAGVVVMVVEVVAGDMIGEVREAEAEAEEAVTGVGIGRARI